MEQMASYDLRARVQQMAGVTVVVVLGAVYVGLDTTIHRSLVVLSAWSIALLALRGPVSLRPTALSVVALGIVASAESPNGSDLWYYQAYGRIVEEFHANPYVRAPSSFVGDPVIDRTANFYRDTGSIYGPLFVAGAAMVSFVTGTDELAGRLAWQGLAFGAVVALLAVLRRLGVPWEKVFLVGASPVVVYLLVNQAHNDVFVGLLLVVGVASADRRRPLLAVGALTCAALIKAPAGIALLVHLFWLASRGERRTVAGSAALAMVLAVAVTAPFGIRAVLGPLADSGGTTNATSIWNFVRGDASTFLWRPERSVATMAGPWVSSLGIVVPVVLAMWATWRCRHRPVHEPMTIALVAWLVFSSYPSVWYSGWFVSLAALWAARESRLLVAASVDVSVVAHAGGRNRRPWLLRPRRTFGSGSSRNLDDRRNPPHRAPRAVGWSQW